MDWVTLAKTGRPNGEFIQWFYEGLGLSGELTFKGQPAGDYEIRYFLNDGYELKKMIPIRVVK